MITDWENHSAFSAIRLTADRWLADSRLVVDVKGYSTSSFGDANRWRPYEVDEIMNWYKVYRAGERVMGAEAEHVRSLFVAGEINDRHLLAIKLIEHPETEMSSYGNHNLIDLEDDGIGLNMALAEARSCLAAAGFLEWGKGSLHELWVQGTFLDRNEAFKVRPSDAVVFAAREVVEAVDEARPVDWARLTREAERVAETIRDTSSTLRGRNPNKALVTRRGHGIDINGYCACIIEGHRVAIVESSLANSKFVDVNKAIVIEADEIVTDSDAEYLIEAIRLREQGDGYKFTDKMKAAVLDAIMDARGAFRLPVQAPLWQGMYEDVAGRRAVIMPKSALEAEIADAIVADEPAARDQRGGDAR